MITFHRILAGCEAGNHDAWQTFLQEYTRIALSLCQVYLPLTEQQRRDLWREAVCRLADRDYEHLRNLSHQAEREFLVDLRAFLLKSGGGSLGAPRDGSGLTAPNTDSVESLLKDLPLLHHQFLFMKLAGYTDGTLEKILLISSEVAKQGLEKLHTSQFAVLGQQEDR